MWYYVGHRLPGNVSARNADISIHRNITNIRNILRESPEYEINFVTFCEPLTTGTDVSNNWNLGCSIREMRLMYVHRRVFSMRASMANWRLMRGQTHRTWSHAPMRGASIIDAKVAFGIVS